MRIPRVFNSVRYMLAGVNGILLLTGLLLLAAGVTVLVQYHGYQDLITRRFFSLPRFVIATAALIGVAVVLGFYAAISQQMYSILAYLVLLIIILVFEVAILVVGFNIHQEAASEIRSTMVSSMQLYSTRIEVAKLWDDLQMGFECCGATGRNDWGSAFIPVSCCHIDYGTISPFECTVFTAYSDGCAGALGAWLGGKAFVLAVSGCVCVGLQVLMTAVTGWLTWRSKFEIVELES